MSEEQAALEAIAQAVKKLISLGCTEEQLQEEIDQILFEEFLVVNLKGFSL